MSNPFISVEYKGLDQVIHRISSLPKESIDQILDDTTAYALDVIKEPAAQKSVTRKAAYGVSFFSDRQRRYFFAVIADKSKSGPPYPHYARTGTLAAGWTARRTGTSVAIGNNVSYAAYVQGDKEQSRHEAKVGWKKITTILEGKLTFKSSKFRDVVMKAVQKAIRKLNLG